MMQLTFMGATQTVTGSRFLLEAGGRRILVDCGLFQGLKKLRLRNWEAPPVDPASVDTVVLTHAHIDHTGYLPCFVSQGFRGNVIGTAATVDLLHLLLPDSAHLQEEEARYRNKHRLSKHEPALPLYTAEDAEHALSLMEPLSYRTPYALSETLTLELLPAGHILGSAFARFSTDDGNPRTILFTGDIGRMNQPILKDPSTVAATDYLVLESTYGNRLHGKGVAEEGKFQLRDIIVRTAARGGTTLIPSFAIGRAQELLYILRQLEEEGEIPTLPVFVDSPMAIDAVGVFRRHEEEHDQEMQTIRSLGGRPLSTRDTRFTRSTEESKAINEQSEPSIIISASGMATGGRILHHLTRRLGDDRTSVAFVGFQAAGTRGRALLEGADRVRIFGMDWQVRAEIHRIDSFSAHGDYGEILDWLEAFERAPLRTFLVHGEPDAIDSMSGHIRSRFEGWDVVAPEYLDSFSL